MFKTYIDNTVYYKKREYHAAGWIISESERLESVMDVYDSQVDVVLVEQEGVPYLPPLDFEMEPFIAALINHIDYDNHVEDLGKSLPYNDGGDLEGDTHG